MPDTATRIARRAGKKALEYREDVTANHKADGTYVTEADYAVEQFIREQLQTAFPSHQICGEETATDAVDTSGDLWLVDPIDGTTNYVSGLPIWAVSICLLSDGVPQTGIVYLPVTDEMFTVSQYEPPRMNGTEITVNSSGALHSNSLVSVNSQALDQFGAGAPCKFRNLGAMAAHAAYTASGATIGAIFYNWQLWDIAAGFYIAWKAGAVARYADGRPLNDFRQLPLDEAGGLVVLGTEPIVEQLLQHIHSASA